MSHARHPHSHGRGATILGRAFALLLVATMPAQALDITVDILTDPVPNGCSPGNCSLREAVTLANSLSGPDRIFLPATPTLPLQLTIPGDSENVNATGDIDVLDDLEIIGTGVNTTTLVQTAADRVLHTTMNFDQRLVLRGLTIQGGRGVSGGALNSRSLVTIEDVAFIGNEVTLEGGAIAYTASFMPSITETRLVLRRVRFENNIATQATNAYGGALHLTSFIVGVPFVLIEDCEFIGNQAKSAGGAILLTGSVNSGGGTVVVRRSQFSGNSSDGLGGGAIFADYSSFELQIEDSQFDANVTTGTSSAHGGAIYFGSFLTAQFLRSTFSSNSGVLGGAIRTGRNTQVIESHFFNNTATRGGGAVWAHDELLVERSTFQSNQVSSTMSSDPGGGAIAFSGGAVGIQRSTFSGNDAFRGGAISLETGQMQLYGSTVVASAFGMAGRLATAVRILDDTAGNALAVANTIINGTCSFPSAGRQLAVAYNNIEAPNASCRFDTAAVNAQNQTAVSASLIALGPLANNGGPTLTRLPGAGSIAINQGRESYCTPLDQRKLQRADASCDVGAVEVGATVPTGSLFGNGFE